MIYGEFDVLSRPTTLDQSLLKMSNLNAFYVPDCILCTQCRRSSAWIKQNTMANIVNIGVSSAWNLYGMHPGLCREKTYIFSFAYIVPYHTTPHHTIPYHTIPYHTTPYNTIPYHAMPCHAIPYHTIPYHTIPYHTIPYHTIPYHTSHTIPCHTITCHTIVAGVNLLYYISCFLTFQPLWRCQTTMLMALKN